MVAGCPRAPGTLAVGADEALALELADDLAGGIVGQPRVPREIGLRRFAQPPQQGQNDPLVELPDLDRIAALTGCTVAHVLASPCHRRCWRDDGEGNLQRDGHHVNN